MISFFEFEKRPSNPLHTSINLFFSIFSRSDALDGRENFHLDFEQHALNTTSGLYFDEMGHLQLYHSEWAFVTYINLSYFTSEAEHLERTVNSIQNLCDTIKTEVDLKIPSSYCENTMPQLHVLLEDVKEYSTKWFLNHETEAKQEQAFRGTRRKKRGFFATVTKRLFFSMSEEEAEFYKSQINELKRGNIEHFLLTQNQTTLFQESLKVLNSSIQSQIIQKTALQKQLGEIEDLLNNATASDILSNKLIELMQYTSFVITSFWEKQRYFFEAVTTKSSSFQLIPPRTFMNELARVNQLVARQELQLPLPLTGENLSKFYQMTTTEGRIIDNNLVIRMSIPLVEAKKFVLYRAISVPHRNDSSETFTYITPRNEYIAFDSLNDKSVTLTYEELKACHRLDRKNLVCKQTFPVMSAANNLGCEINMLRNTNETSNCDMRTGSLTEELWAKLQRPNTYLYTLPKPQLVAIICPNTRTKVYLERTGIISMTQRCRVKTERVEIVAFQTIESKVSRKLAESAKFNVSVASEIDNAKNVKSLSNPTLPDISGDGTKQIKRIHDGLDEMHLQDRIDRASVLNILSTDGEDNINPIWLIIIAIVVILLAIFIAIICFKYCAIQGCNIIIFLIVVAIATPLILFFF